MDLRLHRPLGDMGPDAIAALDLPLSDLQVFLREGDELVALDREGGGLKCDGTAIIAFDIDGLELLHDFDRPLALGIRARKDTDGDVPTMEMSGISFPLLVRHVAAEQPSPET